MLNVSSDEYSSLAYAYQREKADRKHSVAFTAFNKLYGYDPSVNVELSPYDDKTLTLTNGKGVSGSNDIKRAIYRIISAQKVRYASFSARKAVRSQSSLQRA